MEYRKGHDLVIQALRVFYQKYPGELNIRPCIVLKKNMVYSSDTFLVTAWFNAWDTDIARTLGSAPRKFDDEFGERQWEFAPWLERLGFPKGSSHHLGLASKDEIASLLRSADVAVFPNRAEGGTNLVGANILCTRWNHIRRCGRSQWRQWQLVCR